MIPTRSASDPGLADLAAGDFAVVLASLGDLAEEPGDLAEEPGDLAEEPGDLTDFSALEAV